VFSSKSAILNWTRRVEELRLLVVVLNTFIPQGEKFSTRWRVTLCISLASKYMAGAARREVNKYIMINSCKLLSSLLKFMIFITTEVFLFPVDLNNEQNYSQHESFLP
jgi:hypothetical protein